MTDYHSAELLSPQPPTVFDRVGTKIRNVIHTHTPQGRRDEYLAKWNHVLEGVSGLPRFELEKRLSEEAGKYARDRVVRDVLVAAGVTAGIAAGALGVNEIRKRDWNMGKLFSDLGTNVTNWAKEAVTNTASTATKLGLQGATNAITRNPNLVADLASRATEQTVVGVQKAAGSRDLQNQLRLVGFTAVDAAIDGATIAVEAHASAAPDNARAGILRAISNLLSRATGKK